ncbi:MAG: molybdopterin biosynthesis protein [Glaciihabitans sp.]|nr:molybdopterin biosynthesis protein [Glaciihabitans sp.]
MAHNAHYPHPHGSNSHGADSHTEHQNDGAPHDTALHGPDPSVDEYAAVIRSLVMPAFPTTVETVPLAEALSRRTASAVLSPVDLPLFRNSQMDGYAVDAASLAEIPVTLPVVGEVAARPGVPPALLPGTAVKIMTGAVVPDGADAVVPVEDTWTELIQTKSGDNHSFVTITRGRTAGEFVRDRGSDALAGALILPAGQRLAARHLAVLAAAGLPTVDVMARVKIAVITTGAELLAPGEKAMVGQVYDANTIALVAAVEECGAVVSSQHRVVDDPAAMRAALQDAIDTDGARAGADLVITSGGISMGDYEVVREVLESLGGTIGHIAMQPGGPQATALVDGVPVISFPGNPVSTQISFAVFLAPLLRESAGLPAAVRRSLAIAQDVKSVPGKRQFLRGRIVEATSVETTSVEATSVDTLGDATSADAAMSAGTATSADTATSTSTASSASTGSSTYVVELVSGPSSHLVAGLAAADVLIDVPTHVTHLTKGDIVETVQL